MTNLLSLPLRLAASAAFLASVTAAGAAVQSVVVMSGLNEPRDVAIAPNGDIHVIEAGTPIDTTGLTAIATDTGPAYFGTTGSISVLSGGTQIRTITGLPMLYNPANGGEVVGGHGIAVTGSGTVISIGLGGTAANRATGPAGAASLGSVFGPVFGSQVDVAAFVGTSSNAFHLDVSGGSIYFADAGDNSVLMINGSGVISRVGYLSEAGPGIDFVPTGVAVDQATGGVFVGGLTGVPFIPGAASIQFMNGGVTSLFASGFTNITDIEQGPDGTLYVLEYATNGIFSGNPTGGLWSLSADGLSRELLMSEGLINPTGLTSGPDGTLYVTHSGGGAGAGQLLAITVPEPGVAGLAAAGLAGLLIRRRVRA